MTGPVLCMAAVSTSPERPGTDRFLGRFGHRRRRLGAEVEALDRAIAEAVVTTPTPLLDPVVRRLARASDYKGLWLATSVVMAVSGARADGILNIEKELAFRRQERAQRRTKQEPGGSRSGGHLVLWSA